MAPRRPMYGPNYWQAPGDRWNAFAKAAAAAGWPFAACQMTAEDALVVDDKTRAAIEPHQPSNGPELMSPDEWRARTQKPSGTIFVLMRRGERRFTREASAAVPGATVRSVTYGASTSLSDLANTLKKLDLTLLVASPACGSDYLLKLMSSNKLAATADLMAAVDAAWISVASDFDVLRFAIAKLKALDVAATEGRVCLRIELDQLDWLRESGLLLPKTLKRIIEKLSMRCLYMIRRNKADQAALIDRLSTLGQRSVARAVAGGGFAMADTAPDVSRLRQWAFKAVASESSFERFLNNLNVIRVTTFEEVQDNPVDLVSMIASYLDLGTLRNIRVADIAPFEPKAAWLPAMRKAFKADALEYLVIEKNPVGSYESKYRTER